MTTEKPADSLVEFTMSPFGKGESLSAYVSPSLDIVDQSGLDYLLTPMGTIIEGEWDQVMAVIGQCFRRMSQDCERISCSIKVDHRRGRSGRLQSKTRSVERAVGRPLRSSAH